MKKVKLFEDYNLTEKKITLSWNDDDSSIVFSDGAIARVDYDGAFQYRDEWFETYDHEGAEDLIRDLEKRFKRDRFEWINESYMFEANNMRTLRGFLKELKKEYGPTPTEQSLADFIYNNYEEVTGEKMGESDPANNSHIADIVAHFKMDGEDFMIAWEDRTNESKVEEGKVKVFIDKIMSKMVDSGLGTAYNPKMREEIKQKIEDVVKETMEKYDYIVESELHEKNLQVEVAGNVIEYTLRENLGGNGITALASSSEELDKEIESGASKTAIAKDIEDNINNRLKRMRQDITVSVDYRYEGAGYGFKLNLDGLLQKLNK